MGKGREGKRGGEEEGREIELEGESKGGKNTYIKR